MFKKSSSKGFTLIELMVVIAIIGVMTAIIVANINQSRAKARDVKRVSDVNQIQLAVTLFFDRCNIYPAAPISLTDDGSASCPSGVTLGTFLGKIPTNIDGTSYPYATTPGRDDYHLGTTLEIGNAALKDKWGVNNPSGVYSVGTNPDGTQPLVYDVGSK
jgi:prepilin-type N-terminal cleavage/methylation domain-containing protein